MTDTTPSTDVEFDHHSVEFAADRYGTVQELREIGVAYSPIHGGFYALTRYEDVYRAALDSKTFINGREHGDPIKLGAQLPPSEFGMMIPEESDPPDHTAYRRAMAPYFTAKAAEQFEDRFLHWTTVCIDDVIESGRIDFVTDLTGPVAFLFFCEMIGLPVEQWRRWQEPIHTLMTSPPGSPEAVQALADEEVNNEVMRQLAGERREDPRDDLISQLAQATGPDGELLTPQEVGALARIVLFGAVDSVGGLVNQSLNYLDQHPDDLARLIDDPSMIPTAVEEFLRYFSPGTTTMRTASVETEVGGRHMDPGDRVMLTWIGANHDPEAFPDPDRVILDRTPNRHLAFGAGIHKCIGLQFARLEARIFLEQIFARMPDFRLGREQAVPTATIGLFSGYWNLPATFTPGPRLQDERRPG